MSTHGGVLPPVVAVIELETKAMRRFAKISQAQAPSSAFTFKTLLRHYAKRSSNVRDTMLTNPPIPYDHCVVRWCPNFNACLA